MSDSYYAYLELIKQRDYVLSILALAAASLVLVYEMVPVMPILPAAWSPGVRSLLLIVYLLGYLVIMVSLLYVS
jgi:hypothetical protein